MPSRWRPDNNVRDFQDFCSSTTYLYCVTPRVNHLTFPRLLGRRRKKEFSVLILPRLCPSGERKIAPPPTPSEMFPPLHFHNEQILKDLSLSLSLSEKESLLVPLSHPFPPSMNKAEISLAEVNVFLQMSITTSLCISDFNYCFSIGFYVCT